MNPPMSSKKRPDTAPSPPTPLAAPAAERWMLKPAKDKRRPGKFLIVRDPTNMRILPGDGGKIAPSHYWRRRLACGDVEHCKQG